MGDRLTILVIEDSPTDFRLVERHLERNGMAARCVRVSDPAALEAALEAGGWDIALADHNVPGLRFEDGLARIRDRRPDLPVVLISGSVGEETAVELLKLGVWDFVLKDNLVRLIPVIGRALRDAADYRARAAAERALRDTEERLRLTLEAAEVVAWEITLATGEIRESGPVAALFGQSAGFRHADMPAFLASVHPDDRDRVARDLEAVARGGGRGATGTEFRVRHPDGAVRWLMTAGALTLDDAGRPVRVLGIARDITRRKQAEEAAQRANADLLHASRLSVLGEVASAIAHEVAQPIGAARNYLQAARYRISDPASARIFDLVDTQLIRAVDTMRKVRDFAADRVLETRPEAVRALIDEACALGLLGAADRNIQVTVEVPEGLSPVVVDRVRVQQILVNLLRNAVEAVEGGERRNVSVSASPGRTAGMVEIIVADTGPGIGDAVRARLFTAFTSTKPDGTGLGLSISRSIAEAHGGDLRVEDNPGGGAAFRLTLPAGETGLA